MDHPGKERLREHLRSHNRRVLGLTLVTLFISVILWAGLYAGAWWLFLLFGTATESVDFRPNAASLMRPFIVVSALLCFFAWLGRRLSPNEAPRDHRSFWEHMLDVILAVPRVTLSVLGTSSAGARLNDIELEHAWMLLRRMDAAPNPVHLQQIPADIPDPDMRDKILLALQLTSLVDIRPTSTGPVLTFHNAEARRLTQERVRLRF